LLSHEPALPSFFVPAIHALVAEVLEKDVDARDKRDKPGHDG
jgi:hypothetical protein